MRTRNKQLIIALAVVALAVALFSGTVLAHPGVSADSADIPESSGVVQESPNSMMGWMDQETWGEMIQHMIQIHGPELTGQMIQWMNSGDMPCDEGGGPGQMMGNGFGGMMGRGYGGMTGWRFNGNNGARSMMGNFFGR